ncbi:F-box protein [Aspergillus thermomutatus]|uniref:F-box domain-containing protein n=1 Tax=Aspergillus thermomutatus TaxID=41047 RepID=A0A397GAJ6_ASPTH|nr:uncharacterized protein CDV56_100867 [Aspergillus thermomutatus]RHZ46618.1 hypothetical protein CDV56_100867 [Aspergillus thermomutatus]
MAQYSPLTNLPTELQLLVLENLDHGSKVCLSQTNRYFRSLIDVKQPGDAHEQVSFLKNYEQWPENANKHACYDCRMMLPDEEFDDNQTRGSQAKNGSEAEKRFCIRCGLLKRLYNPIAPVSIRGKVYYRCTNCKGLQGWGSRCVWCWQCSKCLGYRKFEVIQRDRCPECGCRGSLRDIGPERTDAAQTATQAAPATQTTQSSEDNAGEGSSSSAQPLEDDFANLLV